ncbi:MAG: bacillithiol biosynthesis BshC [bacterium]|nr:bacillithiol biosynthesis BshC [bacterium]
MTMPPLRAEPGPPLADLPDLSPLVRAWVRGDAPFAGATAEWRRFLAATPPDATMPGAAPAWRDPAWRDAWQSDLAEDLPDDAARAAAVSSVAALAAGAAEVVVTGQQPGFLGGPLLTLHKVAACIAAARARTAAGHPTIPLFWCGDDDDDRREAFAPRLFDPRRRALLGAPPPPGPDDLVLGAAPAAVWAAPEAGWLAEHAGAGGLGSDLAALWARARLEGWTWGRLQRRALLRTFAGCGLLVVSGDDGRLHRAAAAFYAELIARRAELAALAAARGAELSALGYHAQIEGASLTAPFHRRREDGRERVAEPEALLTAMQDLRPGVLLRTLVQDWCFRPAGIVAGPGELAYLEQLRPLHGALGLAEPALLPRLFARLSDDPARDAAAAAVAPPSDDAPGEAAATAVEAALAGALKELAGLPDRQARAVAARAARSWRDDVRAAFRARAAANGRPALEAAPAWAAPDGVRQERALAMHWATALWGDDLVAAAIGAAEQHYDRGADGDWRDWWIRVDPRPLAPRRATTGQAGRTTSEVNP